MYLKGIRSLKWLKRKKENQERYDVKRTQAIVTEFQDNERSKSKNLKDLEGKDKLQLIPCFSSTRKNFTNNLKE